MNTIIEKTKEEAIETAKELLCEKLECNSLKSFSVKNSHCSCECGETYAVDVAGWDDKDNYESVIVGVCDICGE